MALSPKTKEKTQRIYHANYASTHLFTAKSEVPNALGTLTKLTIYTFWLCKAWKMLQGKASLRL
jgi:hypothetical protein